jgi:hypothetical protein
MSRCYLNGEFLGQKPKSRHAAQDVYIFTKICSRVGRYVVLKILTADWTVSETETSLLKAIAQSDVEHPGRQHVMTMKEHFKHSGPNGEHGCLVFDPMGRSVANVLENLSKSLRPKTGYPQRCAI